MPEFGGTLLVRSPDLQKSECEVTWMEAFALAIRGEIEAVATSAGRIKYFRRLRDEERPEQPASTAVTTAKSASGGLGAALHCYYEEEINSVRVGTLMMARGKRVDARLVAWSDRDGFNPLRFNPDNLRPVRNVVVLSPPLRAEGM
jgi:hypothetical protein